MIRKYIFGNPFPTGATVQAIPVSEEPMPCFRVIREGQSVSFQLDLSPDEMIFGLGESVRGINKRGLTYREWN